MKTENKLAKFTDAQLKMYRTIFIVLSIFLIPFGLLTMLINFVLGLLCLLIAIIELSFAKTYKTELKNRQEKINKSKTIEIEKESEFDYSKIEVGLPDFDKKAFNTPHVAKEESPAKERHNIAGTSYRQNNIKQLGVLNYEYDLTKTEIINELLYDEKIYQYNFYPESVVLEEEPDNIHDPNAIKVIIDDIFVGYIKRGSCNHIKKLIREDKIQSISAEIYGGKYKTVFSDYDVEKDKEIYQMDKGETDFFVSIYITLK